MRDLIPALGFWLTECLFSDLPETRFYLLCSGRGWTRKTGHGE